MFRRLFWFRIVALSGTVLAAVASTAAAQGRLPCSPPELIGEFGFRYSCTRCSISDKHIPGRPDFEFVTEPVLRAITKGGPSDGKLEEYDVLVALNGQLITTQAGGMLFFWSTPGKPVRVTYRRDGALKDVDVVPAPRCRAITGQALLTPAVTVTTVPSPAPAAGRGRLGVYLSCGNCGLDTKGPPFSVLPEIKSVVEDSPAEKAGLKAGDLLVAIDNLSLRSPAGIKAFRDLKPGQKVVVSVLRDADLLKVSLIAAPPRQ